MLVSTIIGYAIFYFVRQNLPMAMPAMQKNLGIDKEKLGRLLTLNGVLYGVAKFTNGFIGDRANARAMMAVGLAVSAVLNICFGMSSALVMLGVFWMLNG